MPRFFSYWSTLLLIFFAFEEKLNSQPQPPGGITVYVFLHPECVISRYVTGTLRELYQQYSAQGVMFLGVFPDQDLTEADLRAFAIRYKLPFDMQADPGLRLTHQLGARVTPEVFVTDAEGRVLYGGRVDDRYYKVGGMRPKTSTQDLAQALRDWAAGMLTEPRATEAVGCFIPGALVSVAGFSSQGLDKAQKVVQP